MNEKYERHISRHIQKVYCRRLGFPVLYLAFLAVLWMALPLYEILFPLPLDNSDDLNAYKNQHSSYVEANFSELYFTGYTNTSFGQTTGYYYYTLADGLSAQEDGREAPCIIVLLSPSTCEEGLPFMESVHIRGRVLAGNPAFQTVLENLAKDLNWTKQGISEKVSNCFVSEPAFLLHPMLCSAPPLISSTSGSRCLPRPAASFAGTESPGSCLPRRKRNLLRCRSLPLRICLLQSIILSCLPIMGRPLSQSRKWSGFTSTLPYIKSCGTISVFPIRCM